MYRGRKKMNPILPLAYATQDVEAHVWPQDPNRVYLYCSNDRIDGGWNVALSALLFFRGFGTLD